MNKALNILYFTALQIVLLLFLLQFISAAEFAVGLMKVKVVFPVGLALSFLLVGGACYKSPGFRWTELLFILLSGVIILIVSIKISSYFIDTSYDGQEFHQQIIMLLHNGWNPFRTYISTEVPAPLGHDFPLALPVNHFTKGSYLIQNPIYSFFSKIETAKASNLLLLAASFLLTFSFILKLKNISPVKAFVYALIAAFNPVVINQAFTFLVDGQVASLLLTLVIINLFIYKEPGEFKHYLFLFAVIILAVNIKFTSLVYALIICGAFALFYILVKKQINSKIIGVNILAFVTGVLFIGYNPYVKNTLDFGNPFYPLAGKNKVDIIQMFSSESFGRKTRFGKFLVSIYSRTETNWPSNLEPQLKLPFSFNSREVYCSSAEQTLIGGMGFWFSGIFSAAVLCGLALIYYLWGDRKLLLYYLALIVLLLATIFINPQPWWARYVPQLWLLPVVILVFSEYVPVRLVSLLKSFTLAVILVNIGVIFRGRVYESRLTTREVIAQMTELKKAKEVEVEFGQKTTNRMRLKEFGVNFTETKFSDTTGVKRMLFSDTKYRVVP